MVTTHTPMIDFEQAVSIALSSVATLVRSAKNAVVEAAVISADETLYEVTLSYDLDRSNDVSEHVGDSGSSNLKLLAELMGKRREYRIFLIDASLGKLRGFKMARAVAM